MDMTTLCGDNVGEARVTSLSAEGHVREATSNGPVHIECPEKASLHAENEPLAA
jgi:hypothetical protein